MSSRHPITSLSSQVPFFINSCALPNQTSVPWDNPDIWTNSEYVVGFVSSNIWITKFVPNSGIPNVPLAESTWSLVTPSASTVEKIPITSGSDTSIVLGSMPDKSCNFLIIVGSSCPSISNFKILSWIEWKSKWVVRHGLVSSSAGNWYGVKSKISISLGTTSIPPGCWPVVLLEPSHPPAIRSISILLFSISFFS